MKIKRSKPAGETPSAEPEEFVYKESAPDESVTRPVVSDSSRDRIIKDMLRGIGESRPAWTSPPMIATNLSVQTGFDGTRYCLDFRPYDAVGGTFSDLFMLNSGRPFRIVVDE
jgi:hypothetical protein